MTNLRCDVCGDPAMVSILKDAFGKSDQTANFCTVHAPKHSAIHLPETPLTSNQDLSYRIRQSVSGVIEYNRTTAGRSLATFPLDLATEAAKEIERLRAAITRILGMAVTIGCDAGHAGIEAECRQALSGDSSAPETKARHLQPRYVLEQIMNNSTDSWAKGVARTCLMESPVETSAKVVIEDVARRAAAILPRERDCEGGEGPTLEINLPSLSQNGKGD